VLYDIVALDGCSDLSIEERGSRKKALAKLQDILVDLDATKQRLALLKKDLYSKLMESKTSSSESSDVKSDANSRNDNGSSLQEPRTCMECGNMRSEGRAGDKGFEGQWFCLDCWRAWNQGSTEEPAAKMQSSINEPAPNLLADGVPLVPTRLWEQLELPLQAEISEERDGYVVSYRMRNLQADDVDLQLNHDASQLKICGVHFPTTAEAQRMRQQISHQLSNRGLRSCDVSSAMSCYANIGHGKFGRFLDRLMLPPDVNARCISASCSAGILHVILPKHSRQARPRFTHPLFR